MGAISQYSSPTFPVPTGGSASDVSTPIANTAAVVTYAALPGQAHTIDGVYWSYSATPAGGTLTVMDGPALIFAIDIMAAGIGFVPFPRGKRGSPNTAMTITLSAGGGTVVGKVGVLEHWIAGG